MLVSLEQIPGADTLMPLLVFWQISGEVQDPSSPSYKHVSGPVFGLGSVAVQHCARQSSRFDSHKLILDARLTVLPSSVQTPGFE